MFYKKKKALDKSSYLFLILVINSFALSPSNALKTSSGTAKIIVFDWSDEISLIVAKVLKWSAPGACDKVVAASAKFLDASSSPAAFVMTACFSLSASATLAITILSLQLNYSSKVTETTELRIVVWASCDTA